jgi:hypothetical protein
MPTLNQTAAKEAEESAGAKIVNIGKKRLATVRSIISQSLRRNRKPFSVAKILESEIGARDKRDWQRVARTELANARGNSSFDMLAISLGPKGTVYRDTSDCCKSCEQLFGRPGVPRIWRVQNVKKAIRGAVHPNCRCSEWRPVSGRLEKAQRTMPFGWVMRSLKGMRYVTEISTGQLWVSLDSLSGRSVIRALLMHTPLVAVGEHNGFTVARHGHGRTQGSSYTLWAPNQVMGARYYDRAPSAPMPYLEELRAKQARTWDDYMERILGIIPVIVAMPDFWEGGQGFKYLTEFMGFNQMSDWYVLLPPTTEKPLAVIPNTRGVRAAVKDYTQILLAKDVLRKGSV